MSAKIEVNEVTTKLVLYRIPELLRHRGFDRAALCTQVLHAEKRAISAADLAKLTATERVEVHAALVFVGGTILQMQNELPDVDIPHVLKLIENSIDACDTIALAPLIASMQPAPDCVQ